MISNVHYEEKAQGVQQQVWTTTICVNRMDPDFISFRYIPNSNFKVYSLEDRLLWLEFRVYMNVFGGRVRPEGWKRHRGLACGVQDPGFGSRDLA